MPRPRDIREDIRQRLLATGAFSDAWLSGVPEAYGRGASDANAAALPPADGESRSIAGGGDSITLQDDERLVVTLLARNADPALAVEQAELLLQHLKNAVNGRSLGEMTVPDATLVKSWKYQEFRAPEQRIKAVVVYRYVQDGWDTADTTP